MSGSALLVLSHAVHLKADSDVDAAAVHLIADSDVDAAAVHLIADSDVDAADADMQRCRVRTARTETVS